MHRISLIHPAGADWTVSSRLVDAGGLETIVAAESAAHPDADVFVVPEALSEACLLYTSPSPRDS